MNKFRQWQYDRHIRKFGNKNNGYFNYFNKEWFENHQNILVWLLNHWLLKYWFRWVLRIHKDCKFNEIIDKIEPHTYRVELGENEYRSDFRTHQKFSKRIYYAFYPVWWAAHFIDWLLLDRLELLPDFGFSTLTAFPEAGTGGTTVDGVVARVVDNQSWENLYGAGTYVDTTGVNLYLAVSCGETTDKWNSIYRYIATFDTSTIGSESTITNATFSVRRQYAPYAGLGAASIRLTISNPANNNTLSTSDYANVGDTEASTTSISTNTFSDGDYKSWTENSTGLANISKTGITKRGLRFGWDIVNAPPSWIAYEYTDIYLYTADTAGNTYDPKLIVTYSLPSSFVPKTQII